MAIIASLACSVPGTDASTLPFGLPGGIFANSRGSWLPNTKQVNWILDPDIRSFFDKLQHDWLVRFVKRRIADQRIVRLIRKWCRRGCWSKCSGARRRKGLPKGR